MPTHIPVLVNEILKAFSELPKNATIVDCTLGLWGHSKTLLEQGYNIIAIDRDINAINLAKQNLKQSLTENQFKNVIFIHDNYNHLLKIIKALNINQVDGILIDTGISTYQLEDKERGFGFQGNLDMREDQSQELTAEKIINEYEEKQLSNLLFNYGEKNFNKIIAKNIIEQRKISKITKAEQLYEIINQSIPNSYKKSRKHHWATPTFRALRIEVNNDINIIKSFLTTQLTNLKQGGILAIITFHTFEDRITKNILKSLNKKQIKIINKKEILATKQEISKNPKASKARLRIVRKL